jgi:hypothetical protein
MLSSMLVLAALATQPVTAQSQAYTPEQLAVGAINEIISAQAVRKRDAPQQGYGCSLEQLVKAQLLLETWLVGKRVEGYTLRLWCDRSSTPQATYRASAVPAKKAPGSMLTVCTDETNVARTIEGDEAACFGKGAAPAKR